MKSSVFLILNRYNRIHTWIGGLPKDSLLVNRSSHPTKTVKRISFFRRYALFPFPSSPDAGRRLSVSFSNQILKRNGEMIWKEKRATTLSTKKHLTPSCRQRFQRGHRSGTACKGADRNGAEQRHCEEKSLRGTVSIILQADQGRQEGGSVERSSRLHREYCGRYRKEDYCKMASVRISSWTYMQS